MTTVRGRRIARRIRRLMIRVNRINRKIKNLQKELDK